MKLPEEQVSRFETLSYEPAKSVKNHGVRHAKRLTIIFYCKNQYIVNIIEKAHLDLLVFDVLMSLQKVFGLGKLCFSTPNPPCQTPLTTSTEASGSKQLDLPALATPFA